MTTLNTKAVINDPIQDFEQFVECALAFDHYYAMSDDHRTYLAGRWAEARLKAYAEENKTAQQIWDFINKHHAEMHMVSQLIHRVEGVLFSKARKAAVNELRDFCIPYLAHVGRDTMIGKSVRDAIAQECELPSGWKWNWREEYDASIDGYIANYKRKAR